MPATSLLLAAALWVYWPAAAFPPVGCGGTPRAGPSPIAAAPSVLDFTVLQGATASGTVDARPNGNEMDGYDASRTVPWITLSPESGGCDTVGGCEPLRITVRAGTMAPGVYNGSITLVPFYFNTCVTTTKVARTESTRNISVKMSIPASATPIPSAAFVTLIPHSAAGGGWLSRIFLTNITGNTNNVTVNRIAQTGVLLASVTQTLQPGGTTVVGESEAGRAAPVGVSWFAIGSEWPIAASILFDLDTRSINPSVTLRQSVGSLSSAALSAFTAPVRFAGGDAAVGLALANPNNASVNILLKLVDRNGTVMATDSMTLSAFSQTSFVLSDRPVFGSILQSAPEFVGSLAVTTASPGTPVSAMVVGVLGSALFSLPVTPGVGR